MLHSPVIELQSLAGDPDADIIAVLMKAKMIAVKLDLTDLVEWIELELNGYPNIASVPEYRSGQGQLKAFNPFRGGYLLIWGFLTRKLLHHLQRLNLLSR
ncbi:hypothetical protein HL670_04549 [Serratia plymuthica]|nr:hypothetical protein [Serratia plymuthica]QJW57630.1 hypothetical protein HL670_04549 [Serratia plymuthica]